MLKFVYSNIFMQWYWWSCVFCLLFLFVQRCDGNEFIRQKPAADLAIFGDRSDRPKSPGVPGGAIAIFADRRFKQCARWCARPRRFFGGLALLILQPLQTNCCAHLFPACIPQSLVLSRGWRNARAESLLMRACSWARTTSTGTWRHRHIYDITTTNQLLKCISGA